jgi:hypothetical protein
MEAVRHRGLKQRPKEKTKQQEEFTRFTWTGVSDGSIRFLDDNTMELSFLGYKVQGKWNQDKAIYEHASNQNGTRIIAKWARIYDTCYTGTWMEDGTVWFLRMEVNP